MLVAVCSLKGSPGVSTFAVALAARWPGWSARVLVECDPSGGDIAPRFSLAGSPGLVSLAAAAHRSSDPGRLWAHTQSLPGGPAVVVAPPGADQAAAALATVLPRAGGGVGLLREAASAPGVVVIADCGRVDPGSGVVPLVAAADAMLLLSRAHTDDLAHLAARLDVVVRWSRRPGLLLVGDGHATEEVSRQLGVPVLARIPHDPATAAALTGRPHPRRGLSRSPLGRVADMIARGLAGPPPPAAPPGSPWPPGPASPPFPAPPPPMARTPGPPPPAVAVQQGPEPSASAPRTGRGS